MDGSDSTLWSEMCLCLLKFLIEFMCWIQISLGLQTSISLNTYSRCTLQAKIVTQGVAQVPWIIHKNTWVERSPGDPSPYMSILDKPFWIVICLRLRSWSFVELSGQNRSQCWYICQGLLRITCQCHLTSVLASRCGTEAEWLGCTSPQWYRTCWITKDWTIVHLHWYHLNPV